MMLPYFLGLLAHGLIWQLAEPRLQAWGEKLVALLTGRPLNQTRKLDSAGIPIVSYREHGLQYNPLFVAYQALQDYLRIADPRRKQSFLRLTDWLLREAELGPETLWLPYHFDLPQNELQASWYSALAQAYACSAFARRHELSGDAQWLDYCRKALNTLNPGAGLALEQQDGSLWFLEYPGGKQPFVLNGMLAILLELDAVWRITHLEQAQELFERGYAALIAKLPEFDHQGFSLYDLNGNIASRDYHQKHIAYLKRLDAIRPQASLQYYAKRWQLHDLLPVGLQLFGNPRPKRVLAWLFSLLAVLGLIWALRAVCPR